MISVALVCTRNSYDDPCPMFQDRVTVGDVIAWHDKAISEHAWTVVGDEAYCPRHNPGDDGAIIQVDHGDDYQPIADSGWEIRLPRDRGSISWARVEVRHCRG